MAKDRRDINAFTSGTHNLLSDELIPNDASSESLGWLTKDGRIELMYGRQAQGGEGLTGKSYGEHTAFDTNGASVRFRKVWNGTSAIVQTLVGDTWTDVITGLAAGDVTFSNYASVAGNFLFITSPIDGIFKIVTANPTSYADMYNASKNFKGFSFIDKARTIMWNTENDSTGLYGSFIDAQDSDVYTTESSEATASLGGTLDFKGGGATRNCFALEITITATSEVYTDNYDGTLTGSAGGTGTINYMTGEFTITNPGVGTADYQWEDSNAGGVTDFSKSATRAAGEGFVVRQDKGGDAIQVVIPFDGSYFSLKSNSVYQFTLDTADTNPLNELIRTDVGVKTLRAAVATNAGIMFMNTGNPSKPMLNILQRNPIGDDFLTTPQFPQFKFENYTYNDISLESWDKFVVIACAAGSGENDRMLMCDAIEKSVDVAPYSIRTFAKDGGLLFGGDPLSMTTYELFSGFDDMAQLVPNYWEGKADRYNDPALKKVKKLRFKGFISPNQSIRVLVALDGGEFQWVGTILGSGDYVSYNSTYAIGTTYVGQDTIGGGDESTIYPFLLELKVKLTKFRTRKVKFVAQGYGYCSLEQITDFDIWTYEDKLPKKFRTKENVSLDGTITNEPSPTY